MIVIFATLILFVAPVLTLVGLCEAKDPTNDGLGPNITPGTYQGTIKH